MVPCNLDVDTLGSARRGANRHASRGIPRIGCLHSPLNGCSLPHDSPNWSLAFARAKPAETETGIYIAGYTNRLRKKRIKPREFMPMVARLRDSSVCSGEYIVLQIEKRFVANANRFCAPSNDPRPLRSLRDNTRRNRSAGTMDGAESRPDCWYSASFPRTFFRSCEPLDGISLATIGTTMPPEIRNPFETLFSFFRAVARIPMPPVFPGRCARS